MAELIRERYRLQELLGRGGMGEVWRATDEETGRTVAVKLLAVAGTPETALARFSLEAETAGRLQHPNTVEVFDFGAVEDHLFLVMEFVDGYSLATEVTAFRQVAPDRVAALGEQAALGLAAAHAQGVVHRDIKPANLLVDRHDTLRVVDFGIARFTDSMTAGLTGTGEIVGTAGYLAPERALGRTAGPPSDVYALGCVLYELLTGRPPFRADTPTGTLYLHVEAAAADVRDYRADVPGGLAALVRHMLEKAPDRRPTAAEVAAVLGGGAWRAADPAPASAPAAAPSRPAPAAGPAVPGPAPDPRPYRTRPQRVRRYAVVAGAGAVMGGAAVAVSMALASSHAPAAPAPAAASSGPLAPDTSASPTPSAPASASVSPSASGDPLPGDGTAGPGRDGG